MSIGVATCMIAEPHLSAGGLDANHAGIAREGKKQPSVDNARSTLGREEPR